MNELSRVTSTINELQTCSKSLQRWLLGAAVYNFIFGIYAGLWPAHYFSLVGMATPSLLQLWQCIGMIVGVYGIGYAIAARDPYRHWPIVLVGALGKIFGPLGFLSGIVSGSLPWNFGWTLLTNDLLWWPSFFLLLRRSAKYHAFSIASIRLFLVSLREIVY